jgi:hypothetical protein
MVAVCVGALLPWEKAGRSGVLEGGLFALLLGSIGLAAYALATTEHLDFRWWRIASVPLALGCIALSVVALNGYAALGAIVTTVGAVGWLVVVRRWETPKR